MGTRVRIGIDKSRIKKWKRSGWRESEGKWQRAWMSEMGGGRPEKEGKSRCGKGQGKNKEFHNQSAVRTCCDGDMDAVVLIQQSTTDSF